VLSSASRDAERREPGGEVLAVLARRDFAHDVEDLAVLADDEGPSIRVAVAREDAVGLGDFLRRIAQDGVVEAQRLGELLVRVRGVAARGVDRRLER